MNEQLTLNLISQIPMSIWLYNDGQIVVASTRGAGDNEMRGAMKGTAASMLAAAAALPYALGR